MSRFLLERSIFALVNNKHTAMEKIIRLDTIKDYNDFLGLPTPNPLVSVINASEIKPLHHIRKSIGFYVVYLKDIKCADLIKYGRKYYDFQEETLVFAAPGQVIGNEDTGEPFQPKGWWLTFQPELLNGTPLGQHIKDYTFFSYAVDEALHLSKQERQTIIDCLMKIDEETKASADKHSNLIISSAIELLLNYSERFYDRQFATRTKVNKDLLSRFEEVVEDYYESDKPHTIGTPTVAYVASQLHLSPNYFGDMVRKETGKSAQEHLQQKMLNTAKSLLTSSDKNITEIAYALGYQYPQYFTRAFKNLEGCTPNEYRRALFDE